MSNEIENDVIAEVSEDVSIPEAIEEAPAKKSSEDIAKEKGWRPKEEYSGDEEDFVSAKEYLRVGEMIDRQKSLERQLKGVAKQNQDMYKRFQDAEIQGYKRAVEELKLQRKEALEVGNADQADKITDEMNKYKDSIVQEEQKAKQNEVLPETQEFIARNKDWFGVDQSLTRLAILKEEEFRLKYPHKSDAERLLLVEAEVSPHSKPKATPRPVASASRSSETPSKTKYSMSDLNRDEATMFKGIYNALEGTDKAEFTVDKYIKQLKEIGAR